MIARVIRRGSMTLVQDLGRFGLQKHGVPVSGAMDAWSARVANRLVGNDETAAVLEMTLMGPSLAFEADTLVAVVGGDFGPRVRKGAETMRMGMDQPVRLEAGSVLDLGTAVSGCRGYLAVAGGWDVPPVLGSRSTFLRGRLGGLGGRALLEGDILPIGESAPRGVPVSEGMPIRSTGEAVPPLAADRTQIRVMAGAHWDAFEPASRDQFLCEAFKISPQSDRMGYRLIGPALRLATPRELISEPVAVGTIQVPPDGQPIVLMADRQTTGGYPRIAEVATVDLWRLAQGRPGAGLRFRRVTVEEAQDLLLRQEQDLEGWRAVDTGRRPVRAGHGGGNEGDRE